ncbi:MAG: Tm-1-like ATP-binding domain-containing protein, partial [bacterium]|nr:Tm-1-like ATP-binding domain-containing protein [bacterium]
MSSSPNPKPVVMIGALDTKGAEFAFAKELIESEGLEVLVVDFGTMGEPTLMPAITRAEVAAAAGGDIAHLASGEHKDEAMETMAKGLAVVVRGLYDEGRL